MSDIRTNIEFRKGHELIRTVSYSHVIPNIAVGQTISFDHPTTSQCLIGMVSNIQHVVFLADEPPVTYIDVEC